MAMTTMKCFRIKNLEIYTEDTVGNRELICICPNKDVHEWLIGSLTAFHIRTPVLDFGEPAKAFAPFTEFQILALRDYQTNSKSHSYTCAGNHLLPVLLSPTRSGWRCHLCHYTQNWAHAEHTGVK